ncbi:MAG: 3-deoxy-7-phosphoheptulonate synthase [Holophagaceae bacterium]|nr:3-deoxy-7-phosphoheptulonate synthase [Holophagaceae bacterium]
MQSIAPVLEANSKPSIWTPGSWRHKTAAQQPRYRDEDLLEASLCQLRRLPPLVVPEEVEDLRRHIAEAGSGKRFMLQGGDCAEQFSDCTPDAISDKLRILLQMSVVITHGGRRSVFQVGRIAGQYAKPRSKDTEMMDGVAIPSYRGDLINSAEATEAARRPDPRRMVEAYFHASSTLNHLRALVVGGFADLHHPERWDLPGSTRDIEAYRRILKQVRESIDFIDAIAGTKSTYLRTGEFFTSHEALLLPYEEALTSKDRDGAVHYNLGAHMLWVGDRTRALEGAHIEYLRGIRNPIGVKLGPGVSSEEVRELLAVLDPGKEAGRLVLIPRLGADHVRDSLPKLIQAVQTSGHPVLWSCDPMHGNGLVTARGLKTRDFDQILSELRHSMEIHRALGSNLGAVHFELTGQEVTECLGGSQRLSELDLHRAYETGCDPRLNQTQSLEMAFLIAEMMGDRTTQ